MNELVELADIVQPVAPAVATNTGAIWALAFVALVVLAIAAALLRAHRGKRIQALRRLHRLRRAFAAGAIDARELAYGVAAELQFGLRMLHLRATNAPVAHDTRRGEAWQSLITQLDALRYRPGAGLDAAQGARLVRDAAYWLGRLR